jgi:integrase
VDSSFLTRKGHTWYVRLMVPKAHRQQLGRTKYIVSLKTRDKAEANRLKHAVLADLQRQLVADLAGHTASPRSARALLDLAERERQRVVRGEVAPEDAEVAFDVAVDDFLEQERKRLGTDRKTGHPLVGETETRIIRAAHAVMAGSGGTLLERAGEMYLAEVASTVRKQTLQEKKRHIDKLCGWLGPATDVGTISRKIAGQFVTKVLMPEGKAPKTVRDTIGHLSAFFSWLERRGEIETNPFFRVSGSVRESTLGTVAKRRPWTNAELLHLLKGLPSHDPLWPMVAIAAYSGMRREEIAQLRVADVNGDKWSVAAGKTRSAVRTLPIHPALRPLVKHLVAAAPDDGFLIPGLLTGGADDKRGHLVGKRFTELRHDLEIKDEALNFHTLRNSFLQRCEEAEVPQSTAKLLAGHKRTDLTYGGYSPGGSLELLDKAIRKVTYGDVDEFVKRTGPKVTVTKQSRRRTRASAAPTAARARKPTRRTS